MTTDPVPRVAQPHGPPRGSAFAAVRQLLADRKPWAFAFFGGVGCLLGALVGELLFLRGELAQDVCIVIDASGSMCGGKLAEVKQAAIAYADRQDMGSTRLAVVGFGSSAHTGQAFTDDQGRVRAAIQTLNDGGSTNMAAALLQSLGEFRTPGVGSVVALNRGVSPCLLLFTDGAPNDEHATLEAARTCRDAGIQIVAIGTGDANIGFLSQLTGDAALVFGVSTGNFNEGFRKAEHAIGSLAESRGAGTGGWLSAFVIATWTALLAVGIAVALTHGQSRYLGTPGIAVAACSWAAIGGIGAGVVAGLTGQFLYAGLSSPLAAMPKSVVAPVVTGLSRTIGWTVLGALVARGLAFFVPNLGSMRAWAGGAVGGAVAALAFLAVAGVGDVFGRLVGATILGALIGMMIAFVESAGRFAWLEIQRGRERVTVNLGADPVKVGGNGRQCTVFANGARPLAASYRFVDGTILLLDYVAERESEIPPGESRSYGDVLVTVRTSGSATGSPPKPPVAPPPLPRPPAAGTPTVAGARTAVRPSPPPRPTGPPRRPTPPPPPPPPPRKA